MYKVLRATTLINEEQLETEHADGWRLITIIKDEEYFYFYFEHI